MRKRLETITIIILIVAALAATHLYITFYTPASKTGELKLVNVQKGTSFRVVAANLEKAGVIRDSDSFIFAANILGAYKKIKAGEYEFNTSMTPMEVLEFLVKGRIKRHLVTIPEGFNIKDIAAELKAEGILEPEAFLKKAADKKFISSLGIEGKSLEGYLFPDTYIFTKGMTPEEVITKMVDNFRGVYNSEFEKVAKQRGMSQTKVLTLASIIEKETGAPGERPLISAVFHNRLKKGIKLQSDPTVIYDAKDFDGNLTKKHLLTKSPYNTYVVYGLPPGPIANPGKASISAALNPANEDYLYFVSRNDGTHLFTKNLKDHNKAVNQFQRNFKVNAQTAKKG